MVYVHDSSFFAALLLSLLKLVLFCLHFFDLVLSHDLENFISKVVKCFPLLGLIGLQMVSTLLDFDQYSLDSAINVAFLWLHTSSENVWDSVLWLFNEVPHIGWSHSVKELSLLILLLDLTLIKFFTLLLSKLFILSLLSQVRSNSIFNFFGASALLETS